MKRACSSGDTNLVLRPDSDFFRYFGDPSGRGPVQAGASPPTPVHPDAHAGATAPASRGQDARAAPGTGQVASRSLRTGYRNSAASQRCRIFSPRSGYFFAIEGICLAAFPLAAKRAMESILAMPDGPLRVAGIVSALIGVAIVWLVRG